MVKILGHMSFDNPSFLYNKYITERYYIKLLNTRKTS